MFPDPSCEPFPGFGRDGRELGVPVFLARALPARAPRRCGSMSTGSGDDEREVVWESGASRDCAVPGNEGEEVETPATLDCKLLSIGCEESTGGGEFRLNRDDGASKEVFASDVLSATWTLFRTVGGVGGGGDTRGGDGGGAGSGSAKGSLSIFAGALGESIM